ncbi:MAG: hypothetical protein ACJA1I_001623 [Zhongshania marina]|jgi:hypothetical protein
MAIDFPPALPPQLTTVQYIESVAGAGAPYTGMVNGYELRVSGTHYLSNDELDAIFKAAKTPSQAIFLMNSLVLRKGHLLVTMQYAPDSNVVYVHALQGKVADVQGGGVQEFFEELRGEQDLTRAEFERARVMANVKSLRTGIDYSVSYDADTQNAEDISLIFDETPVEDHDATDVFFQIGNQGSRYVGRYFGNAGISHNFENGTRATFGYETAFTDLGESRNGEDYHRFQLAADRAFSTGLYGITASHTEYSQNFGPVPITTTTGGGTPLCDLLGPLGGLLGCSATGGTTTTTTQNLSLDADINTIALSGEQVLSADLTHRFNLFERIEYIDSQIDAGAFGSLQDEKYGTVEFGAKYFAAKLLNGKTFRWSAQLSLKAGVTGDSGTLGTAVATAPEVGPATRTAEFVTILPRLSAKLPMSDTSEFNLNFLGQFADEQLPQQQQWVLGGMSALSAYLPGVMSGDSGYFITADFTHKFVAGGLDLSAAVFAEYGAAQFENASGALGDERSIADMGVRVSAQMGWGVTVDAVAARPLMDDGFASSRELDKLEADFYLVLKKVF